MKAPFQATWPQDIVLLRSGVSLSDATTAKLRDRGLDLEAEHHGGISPSAIASYWGSPCYIKDRSTSPAAERGTLLHGYLETPNPDEEAGLDAADKADLAWCRTRLKQITRDVDAGRDFEMREVKTYLFRDRPPHDLITWGIVDYLLLDGDRAIMCDFKLGRLAVDVHTSMQLEAYACGVLDTYEVGSVDIHIIQPSSGEDARKPPPHRTIYLHDVHGIKARLVRLNRRVREWRESSEQVLMPSASCQRCAANNDCPASQHLLDVYGDDRLPDILGADWEARLRAAKTMEEIAKRIRKESMQYIRGGGKIETHTVASRTTHKVTDFLKLVERWVAFCGGNDIPPEETGKILKKEFHTAEAKKILKNHGVDFDDFWKPAERAGEAESYTSEFLRPK